jgi:hypothetical protein
MNKFLKGDLVIRTKYVSSEDYYWIVDEYFDDILSLKHFKNDLPHLILYSSGFRE